MRILQTITGYPPAIGGAQLYAHQLAVHIQRLGHSVRVATHWNETRTDWLLGTTLKGPTKPREYEIDAIPVHRLGLSLREKLRIAPAVFSYYFLQGYGIQQIAQLLAGKLKSLDDDWDLIHNIRMGREGLSYASLEVARSLGIPFVMTPIHHPRWSTWLHRHYHHLYRQADALIALTQSEKNTLISLGASAKRIHVTGTGPTLADVPEGDKFRAELRLEKEPIVLFLGQQYRYKGGWALLAAAEEVWKSFPEARFVFVGPQTRFSRNLFRACTDIRVVQLGAVDLQTKTNALAACTLLCVPSAQESFGGVYVEAWMMGKPVIGGDIPAVREVIAEGTGFVSSQNPSELAGKICSLLGNSDLQTQFGEAGKARALQNYSWDRLAQRTLDIYKWTKRNQSILA
jgi:glycosyltransferase involved in cell wall biosynthesis